MSKPEHGPLHERLKGFAGEWAGDEDIFPNAWGPGGKAKGSWRFRLDASGFNLIQDFQEIRDGGYRFDGHGVLTVDPAAGEYVWFWFDSYGYPPLSPSRGGWQGNVLVLEKVTPRGIGRSAFELDGDRLGYRVENKLLGDADFSPVMAGTYRRQG